MEAARMSEHVVNTEKKGEIIAERRGNAGLITLNRPKALNALSLGMVSELLATLLTWRDDPAVQLVAIRGSNKIGRPGTPEALFGGFCAGGDIRYFHQAVMAGDASLGDFFTEEYRLNHLIHTYPKPYVAFMDGIVMGGGMGLSQGATLRIVTEHTKMAMPETNIGLFPDVGGGYFLSRCQGHAGEYLALTGEVITPDDALGFGLADIKLKAADLPGLWEALAMQNMTGIAAIEAFIATNFIAARAGNDWAEANFDTYFQLPTVREIVQALESSRSPWARRTAETLRKRSPLMLHVSLEQIRRARSMSLADELRMERDMVHQCFHRVGGLPSDTVEGIRALAIDKDFKPQWMPARIEEVTDEMVAPFFASPWTTKTHPLRELGEGA
jgi:enoyl-CoA hydratase/carnithine racemase